MMGALLGADEFGFGTVAMIAVGYVMARICHTNNCPVGVTTQKENLRKKFKGTPPTSSASSSSSPTRCAASSPG